MRLIARYISGIFLKNFAISLAAIATLYFFQAVLADLVDREFAASQILNYHLMNLPMTLVQLAAPAALIGTVLTLGGLNRTNELVACHSIGIGLQQIVGIVLSVVFMISCFSLVVQDRILPPLHKRRTVYYWHEMKKRADFFVDFKQDKIWYRAKNLIYNLRRFDRKTETIQGMTVYTFDDDFRLIQVLAAHTASFHGNSWMLRDGTVTIFPNNDSFPHTQGFDEKRLVIPETPKDFQEIDREVDSLRIKELWRYIDKTAASGLDTKAFEVKLHSRLSLSFIPIVMAFLAVPFTVRNRREGGVARDLGICLAVTFIYWLVYSVGLSLGTNGAVPAWLGAWMPSALFLLFGIGLVAAKQRAS